MALYGGYITLQYPPRVLIKSSTHDISHIRVSFRSIFGTTKSPLARQTNRFYMVNSANRISADTAIIGGGLHGCSAALQLAARGVSCIVLEKDYVGRHASGVNAGGVRILGRALPEIPIAMASREMWLNIRQDGLTIPRKTDYSQPWLLLFSTGMRRGEYFNQDRRHIGRDEMRIISEPNARTKSARYRIIPLSDTAKQALEHHPKRGRIAPAITPHSLCRAFTRDLDRVGLDGNLHCLRHSYCSHLVAQGVHMAIVKELAGHSTINVTEKYTHADPSQKKQAVVNL